MPIGESSNGELYFVTNDGTKWSSLGTVTDMEIRTAPDCVPEAHITTILHEPMEFSATLDTDESWRSSACLVGLDRLIPYQEELLRRCMNKKEEKHMKMSEKMALRLHLMMWGDMQKELGDNPTFMQRRKFKEEWCEENFPDTIIVSMCWLCEYVVRKTDNHDCSKCPIVWGSYNGVKRQCNSGSSCNVNYQCDPISKILALPARNPELQYIVDDFNRAGKVPGFHDGYMSCLTDIWNAAGCIGEKFKGAPDVYKDYVHIDAFNGMKEKLAKASGLNVNDPIVEHVEVIRTQAYNKGANDVIGQLDAAFKRGMDEAMEKILKGEIQSDTSKKLEQKGYNRACEDICKEAGIHSSHNPSAVAYRIKDAGWFNCKNEFIYTGKITGVTDESFCSDILARYKSQVTEEYKKQHPAVSIDVDKAFKDYAAEQMKPLKEMNDRLNKRYALAKYTLAQESGLDSDRPVEDHIREIVRKSMKSGAADEHERIMDKIEEMLNE